MSCQDKRVDQTKEITGSGQNPPGVSIMLNRLHIGSSQGIGPWAAVFAAANLR
jgi:hypothetical protein